MKQKLLLLLVLLLTATTGAWAQDVTTKKIADYGILEGTNTSRNLAVGADGTIHIVYNLGAVMYTKSTDGGATFSDAVQVAESGTECEVAVSSNGKVYVAYGYNQKAYIAYSADGSSFTSVELGDNTFTETIPPQEEGQEPITLTREQPMHIAVDGDYVYAILQRGTTFFYSPDRGQTYSSHTDWEAYAFSDVWVDKESHDVVVVKDNPAVVVRYSTDHGATFTNEQPVMKNGEQLRVYYSTAAAGAGNIYMAGHANINPGNPSSPEPVYLGIIDYKNATYTATEIEDTKNRSLCADDNGNVIVGIEQEGKLYYQFSTDGGNTFGDAIEVANGSSANAALNPADGSLLYLYSDNSNQLWLVTKVNALTPPTYSVSLNKEGLNETEVNAWKAKSENVPEVELGSTDLQGVKKGEKVTVTYTGQKKVIGFKVEKKKSYGGL